MFCFYFLKENLFFPIDYKKDLHMHISRKALKQRFIPCNKHLFSNPYTLQPNVVDLRYFKL